MKKSIICDFGDKIIREPVIAKMKNGTLICAMLGGGPTEPHNENVVYFSKSYNDGETWTQPKILFSHTKRGVWATSIYTEYEYPVMFVHTYNAECPYKELQTWVSYSYDNGENWSKPIHIAPYANGMCIRQGIKMSNGETLFPVYHTEVYDGFGSFPEFGSPEFWIGTRHVCGVIISSDGGKNYTPYGNFGIKATQIQKRQANIDGFAAVSVNLWEPNCVEAEDGHLIMYMRDSNVAKINCAESFDYGRTWNHIGNIDIPNADSKIALAKADGKLVMIHNENPTFEFHNRIRLCIRNSEDNGKSWSVPVFVSEENDNIFYPDVIADDENRVLYVAYENARQHYLNRYTYDELGL
ncbi:MAG: exo-alpha-sialidase [Clostridia bacterium]|nr:exo-alpha-sialidase [Clostridia bacterium]